MEKEIVKNLLVAIFDFRQPSKTDFKFGITINECATPKQGAPGTGGTWWTQPGDKKKDPREIGLCLTATNDLLPLKLLSAEEAKTLSPKEAFEKYRKEISKTVSSKKHRAAIKLEKANTRMTRLSSVMATLANK